MRKPWLRLLVPLILLAVTPALAVDGQIPIPFGPGPVVTPIVITAPGSYVLTRNITATGPGPVISIAAGGAGSPPEDVQIDLNGHILDQPADPTAPVIDVVFLGFNEATIRNGTLIGGGAGVTAFGPSRKIVLEQLKISDFSGAAAPGAIYLIDVPNFVIRDNVIMDAPAAGGPAGVFIDGGIPRQGVIEDNEIKRVGDGIIVLPGNTSVEISNNRISDLSFGGFGAGIWMSGGRNCLISQNLLTGTGAAGPFYGITLEQTQGCKVHNNVVGDFAGEGIFLTTQSDDNLILDNVTSRNGVNGMFIDGARNHIERNVMNTNGAFGLRLGPFSFSNNTKGNTAEGNPGGACGFAWSPDFCDDAGPPGGFATPNSSFGDNLMPGGFGFI